MDDLERSMKIRLLQKTLEEEFGIKSKRELIEAVRRMRSVDISMCVLKPEVAISFSSEVTKT